MTTAFLLAGLLLLPAPQQATAAELSFELWKKLEGHTQRVRCVSFSADGWLASGGLDGLICLWNTEGELVKRVVGVPSNRG